MTTFHSAKVQGLDVFYRRGRRPDQAEAVAPRGIPLLLAPVPQPDPGARRALPRPVAGLSRASATPRCPTRRRGTTRSTT